MLKNNLYDKLKYTPCHVPWRYRGFRYKGFNNMTKENLQNAPQNTTVSLVESNNNQTSPQMLQQSPKPSLLRLEQHIEKKRL